MKLKPSQYLADFCSEYPELNPISESYYQYRDALERGDHKSAIAFWKFVIERIHPAPKQIELSGDGGGPVETAISTGAVFETAVWKEISTRLGITREDVT